MIRVVLADDHAIVRSGVSSLVDGEFDLSVVGETGDGAEVVPLVRRTRCDVLVLDLAMPNMDGMEVLRELGNNTAKPAVVVMSMYPEDTLALALLEAGALGYVSKSGDPMLLLRAIRRAHRGLTSVSERLSDVAVAAGPRRPGLPHERLAPRELQTMLLLVEGHTVNDISYRLALSQSTVSGYLAQVRLKLGVGSNGEVLRYARRVGLL